MGYVERDFDGEDIHPIDIVESLAEAHSWDFDRVAADQIAVAIEGVWRTYSVSLCWSAQGECLRLVSAFDFAPPVRRRSALHAVIAEANDMCWSGAFVVWPDQKMMAYRYGLNLAGGASASTAQINAMVGAAVSACERFFPAFQLVAFGGEAPEKALGIAMSEAYGRA